MLTIEQSSGLVYMQALVEQACAGDMYGMHGTALFNQPGKRGLHRRSRGCPSVDCTGH